jgi:hypothetical protein
MAAESVESSRVVRQDGAEAPLLMALLLAWLTFDLFRDSGFATGRLAAQFVGTVAFMLVLTATHAALLIRECDPDRWHRLLTNKRQDLVGVASETELRSFLTTMRRRLLVREIALSLLVTVGVLTLQTGYPETNRSDIPVGAVLLFLAMLGAIMADRCGRCVVRLLTGSTGALRASVLNVAELEPLDSERGTLATLGKRMVESTYQILVFLAGALGVIKLLWDLPGLIDLWQTVRGFLA